MTDIKVKYKRDMKTWDECSIIYECQIVGGHPDILAFENFEEDFLENRHLWRDV